MGRIKLIALDLDGTLLNKHSAVSDENRKAIAQARAQGVTVIVATGREMQSAMPYWRDLELESPLVTANGSEVWTSSGELHKRHTLDGTIIKELHDISLEEGCSFWGYTTEGMITADNWSGITDESVWLKFGYFSKDPDLLQRVRTKAEKAASVEITNSHPSNIEINPAGISKASGILEVCGMYGLEMSQVMAVGDSLNDKAMLLAAGMGVAMGNAQDEVKRLAQAVTGSNLEDGVAQAIRRYVLEAAD
ncbi:Putative phosphatase [Paenibacillus konkukensis]|uniref:Phosphatase n=1 Tax=Paenibacillus konkukensis TaxID=2020716 RepID=A0ABY4RR88_9BACL|nr:Cof-type HAD-IIB family hydrolase [Paenibacillus konkukensis]UQZ84648.1 Putative phosphatase [Paenibacillus konkukensis]